jgi:hypothetical protein
MHAALYSVARRPAHHRTHRQHHLIIADRMALLSVLLYDWHWHALQDYLKEDSCKGGDPTTFDEPLLVWGQYMRMRDALNKTGRPIWFSITARVEYNDSQWHVRRTIGGAIPTAATVTALLDRHHACHTLRYLASCSVCVADCRDGWSVH